MANSNHTYQLVLIGAENPYRLRIMNSFFQAIEELGLARETADVISSMGFGRWRPTSPTVAVYFGKADAVFFEDTPILDRLMERSVLVVPAVDDLKTFAGQVPGPLQKINGFVLEEDSVSALVSLILEGFGLLRLARRLFISYRRTESAAMAIQLYEELDASGFDVFLDTHSIRPGIEFQQELWHRLADADVVLLIDTPDFRTSKWTKEELGQASAMSIGIYQLVWPGHAPERDSAFCLTRSLTASELDKRDQLDAKVIAEIKSAVESLRCRNLASRQNLLIGNFMATIRKNKRKAYLQPERYIIYKTKKREEVIVIPTIGVPNAYGFHLNERTMAKIYQGKIKRMIFLYDQTNIKKDWQEHLAWLNRYLKSRSIALGELDNWVIKNL